ncbi:hypothetical protein PN466_12655 [Roseofilum reptotaenium CS-1145]|uniref:Uncharacterized protein n=1 Tax=Roseofilum reptotaenium AO1-A TaxID=1925591 RepID=A0A1L9QY20_9CYAN|nr:hypothetical protein [Roseofilum reptotaenium]MDB9517797.1 hypothetical protein [Roseofilum reptotaenium CS-1145]OJJ27546.1 hypothetical protein BI308_00840 [Roseofilum reptotaenium AO1-A]
MNYKKFKKLTYQATYSAFLKAREEKSAEIIYIFSIYHSDLFRCFVAFCNTEQALKRAAQKYIQHHPDEYYDLEKTSEGAMRGSIAGNSYRIGLSKAIAHFT